MKNIDKFRRLLLKLFLLFPFYFVYKFLKIDNSTDEYILTISKSDIVTEGMMLFRNRKLVILHKNKNYTAYSLKCTHLGCTLNTDGTKFICPCHGSMFDFNGHVLKGPANIPLKQLKVVHSEDNIMIKDSV